jgi:hypothetical protein
MAETRSIPPIRTAPKSGAVFPVLSASVYVLIFVWGTMPFIVPATAFVVIPFSSEPSPPEEIAAPTLANL